MIIKIALFAYSTKIFILLSFIKELEERWGSHVYKKKYLYPPILTLAYCGSETLNIPNCRF